MIMNKKNYKMKMKIRIILVDNLKLNNHKLMINRQILKIAKLMINRKRLQLIEKNLKISITEKFL